MRRPKPILNGFSYILYHSGDCVVVQKLMGPERQKQAAKAQGKKVDEISSVVEEYRIAGGDELHQSCSCEGFSHRGDCKHFRMAMGSFRMEHKIPRDQARRFAEDFMDWYGENEALAGRMVVGDVRYGSDKEVDLIEVLIAPKSFDYPSDGWVSMWGEWKSMLFRVFIARPEQFDDVRDEVKCGGTKATLI